MKPKLLPIHLTVDNYKQHVKIGDKVWVEEDGCCVATVKGFDEEDDALPIYAKGECNSWPSLHNIYLIDNSEEKEVMTTTIPQFKAMKFRVKDEIHSRLIQETLFKMGYKWGVSLFNVSYTHVNCLYTDSDGYITFSNNIESFNEDQDHQEMKFITTYSFQEVDNKQLEKDKLKKELEERMEAMKKEYNKKMDELNKEIKKL